MLVYVIDVSAVIAVQLQASDPDACFVRMIDLAGDGRLTFPNEVLDELERLARDEPALGWAKGVAPLREHKGAPYTYPAWVLSQFDVILDRTASASNEPSAVFVIAQALQLAESRDVTVVTEDVREKPTRACLRDACERFNLRWIQVPEFLDETGIERAPD